MKLKGTTNCVQCLFSKLRSVGMLGFTILVEQQPQHESFSSENLLNTCSAFVHVRLHLSRHPIWTQQQKQKCRQSTIMSGIKGQNCGARHCPTPAINL